MERTYPLVGVVAVIEEDGRFLMIQRSEKVLAPLTWCFPGGGVEPGESFQEAIIRELDEELNIPVEAYETLWSWTRDDGQLTLHWIKASRCDDTEPVPNPEEVADVEWLTPTQIRDKLGMLPNNIRFLDHIGK